VDVPIDEADLAALRRGRRPRATVQNSSKLAELPINNHTVTLTYAGSASRLDYGDVFVESRPRAGS